MIDPLAFAGSWLEAKGALVEREADRMIAILPPELGRALELPETATLSLEPAGAIPCGLGSALLERLIAQARREVPVAAVRVESAPPRLSAARALAGRFALRNAVSEIGDVAVGTAVYAVLWASWSAQADDRYDGLVCAVACAGDASEPAPGWRELPDPSEPQTALGVVAAEIAPRMPSAALAARALRAAEPGLAPVQAAVRRRHQRDHQRVASYYDALASEARERRRIDPAALEAKLVHLRAERAAKLGELGERFTLRVAMEPVAMLLVEVPVVEVALRVRRRKRAGDLVLRLPSGASALDLVTCDACAGSTARPLVCDDALHRLCERCHPSAEGRPRCSVCG